MTLQIIPIGSEIRRVAELVPDYEALCQRLPILGEIVARGSFRLSFIATLTSLRAIEKGH
jgi:hypothetical protein